MQTRCKLSFIRSIDTSHKAPCLHDMRQPRYESVDRSNIRMPTTFRARRFLMKQFAAYMKYYGELPPLTIRSLSGSRSTGASGDGAKDLRIRISFGFMSLARLAVFNPWPSMVSMTRGAVSSPRTGSWLIPSGPTTNPHTNNFINPAINFLLANNDISERVEVYSLYEKR